VSISVMSQCWAKSKHAGSELLLLLALADFSDDRGKSYPAISTLAMKCRMTRRNVQYILKALLRSGEISIEPNKGPPPKFPNLYQINIRQLGAQALARVQSTVARGAIRRTNGVQPTSPKPSITINNHQTEGFQNFWRIYPGQRKGSKSACLRLWQDEGFDVIVEQIISHIAAMKQSADWLKENGAYVPAPLTYLNQQRWDGSELSEVVDSRFEGGI